MKKNTRHILTSFLTIIIGLCATIFSACSFFENGSKKSYSVSNDYFTYLSFKPTTFTNADLVNHTTSYEYAITINSECSVSLYEFTANVKLYSNTNSLLYQDTVEKTQNISADTSFSFYVKVGQSIQSSTSSVVVTYSGNSYDNPASIPVSYTVTFVYNNSSSNKVVKVKSGNTVSEPASPYKTNHLFSYWCTDEALTQKYDFSKSVNKSFSLYAKYSVDYAALTNTITATTMKANVTVYAKSYNTFLGITTSSSTVSGSGIIFSLNSNGYYFLLTNNHVTVKNSAYDKVSYTIVDYKGNTYTGTMKYQDATYDLAVLYFKKNIELAKVSRATKNPTSNEELVSLGQPLNQSNAISYGECSSYRRVTLSDTAAYQSNVTFNVMQHSCPTDRGSSGGAILNTDLQLVGIHYAGSFTSSGSFVSGYAIPIEKVNEFLYKYFFS